jgi:hypothetical protein
VSDRAHPHFETRPTGRKRERSLSPVSRAVREMSPERLRKGFAVDPKGNYIDISGKVISEAEMRKRGKKLFELHKKGIVKRYKSK